MIPLALAMSGVHWWPIATASSVVAGVGQLLPSGELRTNTFDWPLDNSPFQTTCTPLASAATAGALVNRENVSPLGQANGPSPQSVAPLLLNSLESNNAMLATWAGGPNEAPPSVATDLVAAVPGSPLPLVEVAVLLMDRLPADTDASARSPPTTSRSAAPARREAPPTPQSTPRAPRPRPARQPDPDRSRR